MNSHIEKDTSVNSVYTSRLRVRVKSSRVFSQEQSFHPKQLVHNKRIEN